MVLSIFLMIVFLKGGEYSFDIQGTAYLYKFSGTLKRRSAVAKVYVISEFYRWNNGYSLWGGGYELVWLGRDKGIVQLDPQQADYLLTGGFVKEVDGGDVYLFLDHPCYHTIDAPVERSLYWNKIRIGFKNKKDFFIPPDSGIFYYGEIGFFLRHPDVWWLTTGVDFQYDLNFGLRKSMMRIKNTLLFIDLTLYSGVSMNYTIHPMLEFIVGVAKIGASGNRAGLIIGYRPVDRKTYREAEGVLFAGVRTYF